MVYAVQTVKPHEANLWLVILDDIIDLTAADVMSKFLKAQIDSARC